MIRFAAVLFGGLLALGLMGCGSDAPAADASAGPAGHNCSSCPEGKCVGAEKCTGEKKCAKCPEGKCTCEGDEKCHEGKCSDHVDAAKVPSTAPATPRTIVSPRSP